MTTDIRDTETYAIIGAAMEVHRILGHGFTETVYQHALAVEFGLRNLPFRRETPLPITYKHTVLPCSFRVDFICFEAVLVEIKALPALTPIEDAQVINYLNASEISKALLINFGTPSLQHRRLIV